jgi:hypothetical protein
MINVSVIHELPREVAFSETTRIQDRESNLF